MHIKADNSIRAYYNEIDPFAASWLRELMREGLITKGEVDERSIEDVHPDDVSGYDRVHMFAGIGVWDYALNQSLWGKSEIWTGSCPCQPFSTAGKGKGLADERHLWPAFFHLIEQCKPQAILGEQVSSPDVVGTKLEASFVTAIWERDFDRANKIANKLAKTKGFHFQKRWLDLVQSDLEGIGYAFWPEVSCACSVGAPHLRQRLYWVGESNGSRSQSGREAAEAMGQGRAVEPTSHVCGMANSKGERQCGRGKNAERKRAKAELERENLRREPFGSCEARGMADALNEGLERLPRNGGRSDEPGRVNADQVGSTPEGDESCNPGPVNGFWRNADWIFCRDDKWRAVEPEIFPLVDGATNRVGLLRGAGNSIIAPQAEAFIRAFMEIV